MYDEHVSRNDPSITLGAYFFVPGGKFLGGPRLVLAGVVQLDLRSARHGIESREVDQGGGGEYRGE